VELTGKVWVLYNAKTKQQTKPLLTAQMQKVLLSLKLKEIPQFYLWTPGWNKWESLESFIQSDQNSFYLIGSKNKPKENFDKTEITDISEVLDPSNTSQIYLDDFLFTNVVDDDTATPAPDYGYYFNDFRAEDIDVNAKPNAKFHHVTGTDTFERRLDIRHDLRIEVVLISKNGKTFKSHSKNISTSGTLLEDEVPKDFLNGEFELLIINKFEANKHRGRLHLRGKIVGDLQDPRRLTFKETSALGKVHLKSLLKSYVEYQKSSRKKKRAV
jgi:hypothetical protein